MSIQDLGSLGELIAAIATILTLIYLALQIRDNTRMAKAQTTRELLDSPIEHSLALAANEELAQIVRRGLTNFSKLSGVEQLRFHNWLYPLSTYVEKTWRMSLVGFMDADPAKAWLNNLAAVYRTPGGREYWAFHSKAVSEDFRVIIDEMLKQGSDDVTIFDVFPFYSSQDESQPTTLRQ